MPRRLVLTGYDDAMACVGELTAPRHQEYADFHDCDFHCIRDFHKDNSPSWQTGERVAEQLKSYDMVIWLGADVIVTNLYLEPFDQFRPGLNASQDWANNATEPFHFSMGSYAATKESLPLWNAALAKAGVWANKPLWEQSALQEACREDPQLFSLVTVFPRRFFNAVPYGFHENIPEPWQPGDWLCHLTGSGNERRLGFIRSYFHFLLR